MPKAQSVKLTESYGFFDISPDMPPQTLNYLSLEAGEDSHLYAIIMGKGGVMTCEITDFDVYPKRRGIGTMLMKSLVLELQDRGITELRSDQVNREALLLRQKLFGEELLQFYDSEDEEHDCILPMTTEQVLESVKRFRRRRLYKYQSLSGLMGCVVDPTQVDTSDW